MEVVVTVVEYVFIAGGIVVSLAVAAVGVLTVAALLMGAAWDEHEDPTDEAGEVRLEECRHMAAGLTRVNCEVDHGDD